MVQPRTPRKRTPGNLRSLTTPVRNNHVWSADFKGRFRLKDGSWCRPFTLTDNHSRYLLSCEPGTSETTVFVRGCMEKAWKAGCRRYPHRQRLALRCAGHPRADAAERVADKTGDTAGKNRAGLSGAERPPRADAPVAEGRHEPSRRLWLAARAAGVVQRMAERVQSGKAA